MAVSTRDASTAVDASDKKTVRHGSMTKPLAAKPSKGRVSSGGAVGAKAASRRAMSDSALPNMGPYASPEHMRRKRSVTVRFDANGKRVGPSPSHQPQNGETGANQQPPHDANALPTKRDAVIQTSVVNDQPPISSEDASEHVSSSSESSLRFNSVSERSLAESAPAQAWHQNSTVRLSAAVLVFTAYVVVFSLIIRFVLRRRATVNKGTVLQSIPAPLYDAGAPPPYEESFSDDGAMTAATKKAAK